MSSQKSNQPVLEVSDLSISITPKNDSPIQIINNLNFTINSGERVAIVGESGSGKTVTAMAIMQLLDGAHYQGSIRFLGEDLVKKKRARVKRNSWWKNCYDISRFTFNFESNYENRPTNHRGAYDSWRQSN